MTNLSSLNARIAVLWSFSLHLFGADKRLCAVAFKQSSLTGWAKGWNTQFARLFISLTPGKNCGVQKIIPCQREEYFYHLWDLLATFSAAFQYWVLQTYRLKSSAIASLKSQHASCTVRIAFGIPPISPWQTYVPNEQLIRIAYRNHNARVLQVRW